MHGAHNINMDFDFVAARDEAFDHLSSLFNIEKINPIDIGLEIPGLEEIWLIELEIDTNDDVQCVPVKIFIPSDFPFSSPKFFLDKPEDRSRFAYGLNINVRHGQICTFDKGTNIPNIDKPKELIDVLVRKAKEILSNSLNSENLLYDDIQSEFIAYWNDLYSDKDSVNSAFLSFINKVPHDGEVFCVFLEKPWFGKYQYLLCSTTEQLAHIQNLLEEDGRDYISDITFYIGRINDLAFPFDISNAQIKELLIELDLFDDFKNYLNQQPHIPIITFSVELEQREILLGWIPETYEYYCFRKNNQRPQKVTYVSPEHQEYLFGIKGLKKHTDRISPDIFTKERLVWRTQGSIQTQESDTGLDVLFAGLGSIGANLISILISNKNIRSYKLIDHDSLELENIYRHILGISDVGKKKVKAVEKYLHNLDPLISIRTKEEKFVSVIHNDPAFFEGSDYYFFCTGDVNSENWIAKSILTNKWKLKAFFIWVEPYLAGGHCLYLNGKQQLDWNSLFPDNIYSFNTISKDIHGKETFTEREMGCVTSFTPYSGGYIKTFLGMLYPKILEIMSTDSSNRCFSWIGDKDTLVKNGIAISENAKDHDNYSLVEREL